MRALVVFLVVVSLSFAQAQSSGQSSCPCISNGADYGVTGSLRPVISGRSYNYGETYGMGSCTAHDSGRAPFCDGANPPAWCADSWCYVDPDMCTTGLPPGQSQYFTNLFYSYSTCGTQNTFESWFGSSGSSSSHALPELATVVQTYVSTIVTSLEDNEAELRGSTSSTMCQYNAMCPACAMDTSGQSAWGSTPLTFQQTLSMPLGNGQMPGVDACLGDLVGDVFQRVAASEASTARLGYEYYGSTRGTYMQWPGMEDCGTTYDPRFREWFAGAAAGPKDVVIVIDTSGSMGSFGRMELAKDAAKKVVDTLTDADFATVVRFSGRASAMTSTLQRATRTHRASMRDWISSEMYASGGTNFGDAFRVVFDTLRATSSSSGACRRRRAPRARKHTRCTTRARRHHSLPRARAGTCAGCNRVILFLSDGVPSGWSDSDYVYTQQQLAMLGESHLIAYALGSGADTAVLKQLACENRGILYTVGDNANLGDVMAEYYQLLAPMMEPCHARWISYQDVYTRQELLGVCMAAFAKRDTASGGSCAGGTAEYGSGGFEDPTAYLAAELIGVACVDMSLIASDEQSAPIRPPSLTTFASRPSM